MAIYKARIADSILKDRLAGKGAVLIEGPKWCGKTTTAEQHAKSILYMDDPEFKDQNLTMAQINPKRLLEGATPRLIDEWQLAPKLWDAVRFSVDHRDGMGHYILTGSAVPAETEEIHHTGTGRITWLTMRPMSLFESGESNGEVSLGELFHSPKQIDGVSTLTLDDIAFLTCRGGWPEANNMNGEIALQQAFDYYDAIVKADISRVDNILRNEERVRKLMRSYARHQGAQASYEVLAADIEENESGHLSSDTIYSYVNALKKIFVIEESEAWNPNLRSKTAIRTSDTRYFVDSSIATAALGLGPDDLMNDLNTFGFVFECLCIRDLRVFAESLNGKVYHYRDKKGLECDAVVHLRNGSYGLIEIKLGGDKLIDEGASTLRGLQSKIDTTKMKMPAFMMVLTGHGTYAYRREDGVYVVPVGCLKN